MCKRSYDLTEIILLFSFLIWIPSYLFFFLPNCYLGHPVLCKIEVVKEIILALLLILEVKLSVFHCWVVRSLWIFLLTDFIMLGKYFLLFLCFLYIMKCWIVSNVSFCIKWGDHVFFLFILLSDVFHWSTFTCWMFLGFQK